MALTGLVLSKDSRKYIFAAAIFFVILINNAWFPGSFSALGQDIQYADYNSLFWAKGMHLNDWFELWFFNALNFCTRDKCVDQPLLFFGPQFSYDISFGPDDVFTAGGDGA